jgi:hypothetical protein
MSRKPLASGTRVETHPIALSMMRICGVDPVLAMGSGAAWPDGYGPDYVENDGGTMRMRFALDRSRQVQITVNGSEACVSARGQAFPLSALPAMAGLPLSTVVDHVLFTAADAKVREAESFDPMEDGVGTHFHLEAQSAVVVAS